jgi:hypothetical protein
MAAHRRFRYSASKTEIRRTAGTNEPTIAAGRTDRWNVRSRRLTPVREVLRSVAAFLVGKSFTGHVDVGVHGSRDQSRHHTLQ